MVLFDHGYDTPEAEIMFYNVAIDKPSRQNILGWFAHGVIATPYARMDEQQLVSAALDQLGQIYDGAATPLFEDHVLQNWSKSPYHRGTYSYYSKSSPAQVGTSIDGKVFFAGEAYNRLFDGGWGYMHLASRTAYDTVREMGLPECR